MNKILTGLFILMSMMAVGQSKGTVSGIVLDKEVNNEPLPFANVYVKGTTQGVTTEFDGTYSLSLNPGTYTIVFSFIGYDTVEVPNITVIAGEVVKLDQILGASQGVSLEEVAITGSTRKESESALLTEQKKATVIRESIGAQRLSKIGVSNAAAATSKISGVTRSEGSGDVFIRGLGDRYLSTTMNGLPIPSDDVERKNIDLNLFNTNIIENVSISKTYSVSGYADQVSGNVNINSKKYSKDMFSVGMRVGSNSNVMKSDVWNNFKVSQVYNNQTLGFYTQDLALIDAITLQSWNTEKISTPLAFNVSLAGGTRFELFGNDLTLFATARQDYSYEYQTGIFKTYRSNVLDNSFTDVENYGAQITTTGLIDLGYRIGDNHKISYNTLFVNKTSDNVYEQGRNGEGFVFDQDPQEEGAFVRDQNLKQTRMIVNQLLGTHDLSETNKLTWAAGYNYVWAAEPNRIRNEVNILDANTVQFAHVGDFQQRKSNQKIVDTEWNGYINDAITFKPENDHPLKLNVGLNFRQKDRDFNSLFIGVRAKGYQVESIDDLSTAFTKQNFDNGTLILRERQPDLYNASLDAMAGYANLDFGFSKFSGNVGVRYEADEIYVIWDVANYVGRVGTLTNNYDNILPSLNLKYEINDENAIRFAFSQTVTLPEFKELAPFEYVSPTGRVTRGNPDLMESNNLNFDLKWEMFPSSKELISLTGFYKNIKDPINLAQTRGSSGNFVFDNTGEEANVVGLEFETRWDILDNENAGLNFNFNATKMWFNQDLLPEFQYANKTESDLQGASDFIVNGALSFTNNAENEFVATVSGNYSSDKIFALGAPEDFDNSDVLYNDEIIEKGFFTLDLVLTKQINERFSMNLRGRNLLNPSIEQTQKVRDIPTQIETNETVSSYKNGVDISLGMKYTF